MSRIPYEKDPAAITRKSFALIRQEVNFDSVPNGLETVIVRLIHACGMTDIISDLAWSQGVVEATQAALHAGAPLICDAQMVAAGITSNRLPANNRILCPLHEPQVAVSAQAKGLTRSAAAVDFWAADSEGAILVIGNAPTALFRVLERLDADDFPRPAAILGFPVGFIGAAEAKAQLAADSCAVPFLTLLGRRGGSALAAAAVNALATGEA